MKNITKRIIAVAALLCVAMTSVTGCSTIRRHRDSSSSADSGSSAEDPIVNIPFGWVEADEQNSGFSDPDLDEEDPTKPADSDTDPVKTTSKAGGTASISTSVQPVTEVQKVTEANGQPATEVQQVTEANGQPATEVQTVTEPSGQPATDAAGSQVTQIVNKTTVIERTRVVQVTDAGGQQVTQVVASAGGNTETTASPAANYTPDSKGLYAMWLDISKDENFYFEGDFLKLTFKIKDDVPDGDYSIRISPDLSDITGTSIYPSQVINGTIRVNNGSIEDVDLSSETGLALYGDCVACKQGDTIDYYIGIKNNSGLAAFVIWVYYDANAMDIVSKGAAGQFESIARRGTEFGDGAGDQ